MTLETETTRNGALSIIVTNGMSWGRIGKGQRFVIEITKAGEKIRALVKVASRGSAMVKTDFDDAKNAKISGFANDVTHVLFAVGEPKHRQTSAYLVPIKVADDAYRSTHKAWRSKRPTGTENKTWVIWFNEGGNIDCNGFHKKWLKYRVGDPNNTYSVVNRRIEEEPQNYQDILTIAEAKRRLALSLGVAESAIKIIIES